MFGPHARWTSRRKPSGRRKIIGKEKRWVETGRM
jgi:hypothetical protein